LQSLRTSKTAGAAATDVTMATRQTRTVLLNCIFGDIGGEFGLERFEVVVLRGFVIKIDTNGGRIEVLMIMCRRK